MCYKYLRMYIRATYICIHNVIMYFVFFTDREPGMPLSLDEIKLYVFYSIAICYIR